MTRDRRLQVLDLGVHLLKGLVADVSADGHVRVRDARSVALPGAATSLEHYLNMADGPLRSLATGLFGKGSAVEVLGGEDLVRTGIRRLIHSGDETLASSISQSRQQFVELHGVRQKTFASSVVMRREQRGDAVEFLVGHGYVRWVDLEQVSRLLQIAGLKLGSLLPRLVALDQMCALWHQSPAGAPVSLLVDAGFASTTVALLREGRVISHSLVFAGARDLLPDEPDVEAGSAPLDKLTAPLVSGSYDAKRMTDYLRAVKLAIADLPRLPAPQAAPEHDEHDDEDGEGHGESASSGAMHEEALFTGGFSHCPDFAARAQTELGVRVHLLRPEALVSDARRAPGPAPLPLFTHAIGAARLAARGGAEAPDVAAEYTAALSQASAAEGWRPTNRRFLALAACFLIALGLQLAREWSATSEEARRLEEELAAEESSQEPVQSIKLQMAALARIRRQEELADAKVRYLSHLSGARPDWWTMFDDLRKGTAVASLSIPELMVESTAVAGAQESGRAAPKEIRYRVTGESPSLVQITELVKTLKTTPTFVKCNVDDHAEVPRQVLHGREHKPHLAFTLSGVVQMGAP